MVKIEVLVGEVFKCLCLYGFGGDGEFELGKVVVDCEIGVCDGGYGKIVIEEIDVLLVVGWIVFGLIVGIGGKFGGDGGVE